MLHISNLYNLYKHLLTSLPINKIRISNDVDKSKRCKPILKYQFSEGDMLFQIPTDPSSLKVNNTIQYFIILPN